MDVKGGDNVKGLMTISVDVPDTKDDIKQLSNTSYSETIRLAIGFALEHRKEFAQYVADKRELNQHQADKN